MVLKTKIVIGTTIVQDDLNTNPNQVIEWEYKKDAAQPVGDLTIKALKSISDLVSLSNNLNIEVFVSYDDVNYKRLFYGYLIEYIPEGGTIKLNCKNRLYDLVRKNVNVIYDSNISTSAGVISAIAQDLIETYGGLTSSVQDSGTDTLINIFKCSNTDIYERVIALRDALGWTLFYDDETDLVHFEPLKLTSSGLTLTTSDNILNVPKWSLDMSYMINKLTVEGATSQTLLTESGRIGTTTGWTTSSIQLTKTPDNAELFIDGSNPPTTQRLGGSKDASTGNYYWIDQENKQIVPTSSFTSGDYAIVNYYWSAPSPIQMENADSISSYGLYEKTMSFDDIKSVADAESRATSILAKRSIPFIVITCLCSGNLNLDLSESIIIQDNINNLAINGEYAISVITFKYPSAAHEITLGDKTWKLVDWQDNTETRLKRLEEANTSNQDLLRILKQSQNDLTNGFRPVTPRYRKINLNEYNLTYAGSIYGGSIKPYGQGKYGSHSDVFTEDIPFYVEQYLDIYEETFVDSDFKDSSSTATWGI